MTFLQRNRLARVSDTAREAKNQDDDRGFSRGAFPQSHHVRRKMVAYGGGNPEGKHFSRNLPAITRSPGSRTRKNDRDEDRERVGLRLTYLRRVIGHERGREEKRTRYTIRFLAHSELRTPMGWDGSGR